MEDLLIGGIGHRKVPGPLGRVRQADLTLLSTKRSGAESLTFMWGKGKFLDGDPPKYNIKTMPSCTISLLTHMQSMMHTRYLSSAELEQAPVFQQNQPFTGVTLGRTSSSLVSPTAHAQEEVRNTSLGEYRSTQMYHIIRGTHTYGTSAAWFALTYSASFWMARVGGPLISRPAHISFPVLGS